MSEKLRAIGGAVKHTLRHNLAMKILAVLIAVVIWTVLIMQDSTVTRTRSFSNVPVAVTGTDTLQRNGYIIVDGLNNLPAVRMQVSVPQGRYRDVSAATYNPRIDVSKISAEGVQTVPITTSSSTASGSVTELSQSSVEVTVDRYITRYRIPVRVQTVGEAAGDWYISTPTLSPSMVAVSGPAGQVSGVASAVAVIDLSAMGEDEGSRRLSVPLILTDSAGNPVDDSLMTVTGEGVYIDSIIAEMNYLPKRTVPLSQLALMVGTTADGYEVKNVTVTPSSVTIAASQEILDTIDTLFTARSVDLTGRSVPFTVNLALSRPDNVAYMSTTTVTVAVEIGPAEDIGQ